MHYILWILPRINNFYIVVFFLIISGYYIINIMSFFPIIFCMIAWILAKLVQACNASKLSELYSNERVHFVRSLYHVNKGRDR